MGGDANKKQDLLMGSFNNSLLSRLEVGVPSLCVDGYVKGRSRGFFSFPGSPFFQSASSGFFRRVNGIAQTMVCLRLRSAFAFVFGSVQVNEVSSVPSPTLALGWASAAAAVCRHSAIVPLQQLSVVVVVVVSRFCEPLYLSCASF